MNHIGNQMMLLEHATNIQDPDKHRNILRDNDITSTNTATGRCDPLKKTREPKPATAHNRYNVLSDDDDSDSESDGEQQMDSTGNKHRTRFGNPNKRQRRQPKLQANRLQHNTTYDDDRTILEHTQS